MLLEQFNMLPNYTINKKNLLVTRSEEGERSILVELVFQFGEVDEFSQSLVVRVPVQLFQQVASTLVNRDDHSVDDVQNAVVSLVVGRGDGYTVGSDQFSILENIFITIQLKTC